MKAFTRSKPIKSVQYLSAQSRHARRQDETSDLRVRDDVERGLSLSWTFEDGPKPEFITRTASDDKQPDYLAAFKAFKKSGGVGERRGAQIGIHLLVGVSPEWIKEGGDLHNPENPRNKELMAAAVAWANTWSNGVYAARLDLDETGSSVVDLFVAPVRDQLHKNGSSKPVVSVNKALEGLSVEVFSKRSKHYAALNTSWAEYAALHLDLRLERGVPKDKSGKEHIPPDEYRAMMQKANNVLEAAENKEAAADQRMLNIDSEVAAKVKTEVETKVERIAELTARVVAGVADGSSTRTPEGKWNLPLNTSEFEEMKPFFKRITPSLKAVESIIESAKSMLGRLTGIFKKQGEEVVSEATASIFELSPNRSKKGSDEKEKDQAQAPDRGFEPS